MSESLLQALQLMLIGMVFVFVFLSLLIVIINLMAKYVPQDEPVTQAPKALTPSGANIAPSPAANSAIMAAISAAVTQYRKQA